jgi:uncharacterized membrane protein YphA (DoxX/SURF4 family)
VPWPRELWRRGWVTLAARLALAAIWAWAGLAKISDADAARRAVRAYELFPEVMVEPVAWGLPFVEIGLAVLLLLGLAARPAAWISAVLFLAFIVMIGSAWARGLSIDCGCFGGGGAKDAVNAGDYALEMIRDLVFVGLALLVALGPTSPLALDTKMGT